MRTIAFMLSLVFVFCVPWEGVVELPGLGTAAKLIGFAMSGLWLATVVFTRRIRRPHPFHMVSLLFVAWNALSVFWSADPNDSVDRILTWAQLLVFTYIVWDLYTTRPALLAALQAFILGEYVAIATAVSNLITGNVYYTYYQRFSPSTQSNPDGFGIIVALGIPIAWYLASSEIPTRIGRLLRFVNYAYILAALVGIVLSGTRTALIAAIPGMAFGLASFTRLRPTTRVAIFLLLTSGIFALLPHVESLRSFQRFSTTIPELTEGDLNNRTNNWREGLASFAAHPILGVGTNMYRSVNSLGKLAHNSFISVLVELGLVGFALFGGLLAIVVIQAWRQPRWDASFWLTLLLVWAISASSLTYEYRKATWLFFSLVVAGGALIAQSEEAVPLVRRDRSEAQLTPYTEPGTLLGRKKATG